MNELESLTDSEQEYLRMAIQRLLINGAILREEQRDLYEWCRIQRAQVESIAALVGLKVHWDHEYRLILGIPDSGKLLRRLKQDETIIALALWYDFDCCVKNEGKTPNEVSFTVRTFNEHLETKFKSLRLPTFTRMREILQLFERKSLVRLRETVAAGGLADAVIQVLPTIRLVLPFPDIEGWNRQCERYFQAAESNEEVEDEQED